MVLRFDIRSSEHNPLFRKSNGFGSYLGLKKVGQRLIAEASEERERLTSDLTAQVTRRLLPPMLC